MFLILQLYTLTAFAFSPSLKSKMIVNDVTNINPIQVNEIMTPRSNIDIQNAVKTHQGPISIGGGRYSMGGQTATEHSLQIDMRQFNQIVRFDVPQKKVTVQAGITWRDLQEEIDKNNLAIQIMQSYSNFTVGGSLSVNAHGRYVGKGPLINSVDSFRIVLANGNEVIASKTENAEIFYAAIGGYGGIGVITEVTLNLVNNEKIRREIKEMPVSQYKKYFLSEIRNNSRAVLHNGDIYPPEYNTVKAETWTTTDKPLTIKQRLIPRNQKYWLEPSVVSSVANFPYGTEIRATVLEPLLNRNEVVTWRNYEASYDVARLEPTTPRLLFTYVLQEYFVPVEKFELFTDKMKSVFQKHQVNVLNVSIRHSPKDPGSFLAWAPEEVFSFVIYYKQGTSDAAKAEVGKWTRELIDEVLSVGGRYYLPYQIHATEEQFKKAYGGYQKFFALKKKLDPKNKFRNKLWDHYYK